MICLAMPCCMYPIQLLAYPAWCGYILGVYPPLLCLCRTLDSQRGAASHQSHGRSGRGSHAAAAPRQRLGPQARAAAVRQKESRGGSGASPQSSHASRSPVECKNWRANGCSFGKRCRYTHIPANKGVDAR